MTFEVIALIALFIVSMGMALISRQYGKLEAHIQNLREQQDVINELRKAYATNPNVEPFVQITAMLIEGLRNSIPDSTEHPLHQVDKLANEAAALLRDIRNESGTGTNGTLGGNKP